ncbi:MAG: aspartate 1-decarboxylase [Deltaproteobacteria bacterium]|nr:aspartate 1-decarboxylase [Deltaproteobacteria bacterium]
MFRKLLQSKIHRATITHADVNYEGSITIPPHLLEAAKMAEYQAVNIWNVTNGNRFETYTILGKVGSSDIAVNGAAARLVTPGDLIIIAAFAYVREEDVASHKPVLVFVDSNNNISEIRPEIAGPRRAIAV